MKNKQTRDVIENKHEKRRTNKSSPNHHYLVRRSLNDPLHQLAAADHTGLQQQQPHQSTTKKIGHNKAISDRHCVRQRQHNRKEHTTHNNTQTQTQTHKQTNAHTHTHTHTHTIQRYADHRRQRGATEHESNKHKERDKTTHTHTHTHTHMHTHTHTQRVQTAKGSQHEKMKA